MSSKGKDAMGEDKKEKSALVPRLRFPEFREAIGWEKPTLGSLGAFTGGGTPSKNNSSYWEGRNPWVSSSDISDDSIYEIKINRFISDKAIQETATKVVPANSILLVSRVGVGKLAITKEKICTSQDFTSFTPTKDNLVFLAYSIKSMKEIFLSFNQGMAIKGFTKDDASNVKIPLPATPKEQQKIADCLSSLDDLITAESQKLEALMTYKKGLMQQLFPREGETVPRLRFPEFRKAEGWEEKPLAEVCNVFQGYGFPEALQGKSEGKYPFCKVSDISRAVAEKGGLLDEAANYVGGDDLLALRAKSIPKGATVFAKIGEALRLNRRAYVQKECLIDNNAAGLKAIDSVADDYFVYLLSQLIDLNKHCGGSVPSVNKSTLERVQVVVPSPVEQKIIADSLSPLDDLITAQSQKINALKTHKKGLMQQLFPVPDEART